MDPRELAAAAGRLVEATAVALTCDEPGHPDGHTCLPVPAGGGADDVSAEDLIAAIGTGFAGPFTPASHGTPPMPDEDWADWTHAWVSGSRTIALGRDPDGRTVLAVLARVVPDPAALPAGMPWVDRLVAITGGPVAPSPVPDWAAVESRLGTPLPSDYKRLVEIFGCDGTFDEFFQVFDPDELISYWGFFTGDDPAVGDRPCWPLPGGVIPWSSNEHHESFWWIVEGPDPDTWPVYAVTEDDKGTRFDCTATEFLFRQMTDPEWPFYTTADHITGHWFMKFVRRNP
ncbi:SMI1/KNR4 family protein [Actinomadura sp. WMMB 499]|uniref:SMI1/KNR4 family protein n=1 Tax=Actinomadura sp. WMMB 499 TaxID=1219491 RepID=UPI001245EDAA|nr:SMI1/KNR4 family protein [Actinomadura sp. WMMB 499]QFG22589.1 hypothetical protein F7P10_17155 [Actinomadura sp. WMMB 499]